VSGVHIGISVIYCEAGPSGRGEGEGRCGAPIPDTWSEEFNSDSSLNATPRLVSRYIRLQRELYSFLMSVLLALISS
jgi:hypothetical protein